MKITTSAIIYSLILIITFISPHTVYGQQGSDVKGSLPGILCLLLCDDDPVTEIAPIINTPSNSLTYINGVAISTVRFSNSGGGSLTSCTSSPALPAGLSVRISADTLTCEIIGTPSAVQSATVYTITASNEFGSDTASVTISVEEITISGKITYDLIKAATSPSRLDYSNITPTPVRGASIELLNSVGSVIETTSTDSLGNYTFILSQDMQVRLRVRAELLKLNSAPQYNIKVIDNTNSSALYTLAESASSLASSNSIRDMHAPSGWDGSAYTSTRASAPFAILDSIYEAISDFIVVDSTIVFPDLLVNWSVNNVPTGGDLAAGEIETSFYSSGNLYILGKANNDTDEFDSHIILHEWGHYFEDKLSRSDSIGGDHSGGDILDMRVAFGEGFGNALSGIITDDPLYIDTSGANQFGGFTTDLESNNNGSDPVPGWYNEGSIQSLLYDIYDSADDGSDTVSLGLGPIYQVFVTEQKDTEAFTSIFSFIESLVANEPSSAASISTLLAGQNINGNSINQYGSTETNNGGDSDNVLPVYRVAIVNSTAINLCTITSFGTPNKLSNYRFIRFDAVAGAEHVVTVTKTSSEYGDTDPEFEVYYRGAKLFVGDSSTTDSETSMGTLSTGTHVIALTDFKISEGEQGEACFDVSITTN